MNSGNKAIVAYNTVRRKNIFTTAVKIGFRNTLNHEIYFIRTDDRWQLMDKSRKLNFYHS
jgi:hypothetical protein